QRPFPHGLRPLALVRRAGPPDLGFLLVGGRGRRIGLGGGHDATTSARPVRRGRVASARSGRCVMSHSLLPLRSISAQNERPDARSEVGPAGRARWYGQAWFSAGMTTTRRWGWGEKRRAVGGGAGCWSAVVRGRSVSSRRACRTSS